MIFQSKFLSAVMILALCGIGCTQTTPTDPRLAFPGAEGFGALATGGKGGDTVHVTTLAEAGPGSLRDAVSQPHRIVLFDVAGDIKLTHPLSIASDITLSGESSPAPGVTIHGNSVSLSNDKNVIVRYLRFREELTGPDKKCSINIHQSSNIILDHCSIEEGRWDCLGVTDCNTVTVQYCIIGQGIIPQRFGCLCETDNITFSHNLWINNQSRNPKAKGKVQYINNVVYNYGVTGLVGGHSGADHWLDAINNYFLKGPNSGEHFVGQYTATDKVFQAGNIIDDNKDGKLNGRGVVQSDFGSGAHAPTFLDAPTLHPTIPAANRQRPSQPTTRSSPKPARQSPATRSIST